LVCLTERRLIEAIPSGSSRRNVACRNSQAIGKAEGEVKVKKTSLTCCGGE
jgi:hypothetical protein